MFRRRDNATPTASRQPPNEITIMARTIDSIPTFGDSSRTDVTQYNGVTATELTTVFGADCDTCAVRTGRLVTIAKTDTTVTQAEYDAWTGRYNVTVWN